MSKQSGKKLTKVLAALAVIAAAAVLAIGIIFLVNDDKREAGMPEIQLSSVFGNSMYCGGEGRIDACLKYPDGHIEDGVFTFASANEVITFKGEQPEEENHTGKFVVQDKAWITKAGFELGSSVKITVTCSKAKSPAEFNITVTDAIPHTVSFKYYNENGSVEQTSATVMEGYKVDPADVPEQLLTNYSRKWIVYGNNGFTDVEFDTDEPYYLHNDILVQERLTVGLYLKDYLNQTEEGGGEYAGDVNFGEAFSLILQSPQSKSGWSFDGWYTSLDDSGVKNGVEDGNYVSTEGTLYAKWTKNLKLNAVFKSSAPATVKVVYNLMPDLPTPEYNNDGSFDAWYYLDENNNEKQVDLNAKFTVNSSELYAKVKFPVILDYQGATEGVKQLYITYGDSLLSNGVKLPMPLAEESGWKIAGWCTQEGGKGDNWTESVKYSRNIPDGQSGVLKLYAKRISTVTLNRLLDENGEASEAKTTVDIVYNSVLDIPADLTANNWNFTGYYDVAGTFAADGNEDKKVITTAKYTGAGNLDLYAKWTATANIDTTFKEVAVSSKTLSVTYRGEVSGLHIPEYTNNGKFVDWYVAGRETQIENKQIYTLGANETIYAKVKFPVVFDYQGATQKEEEKGKEYFIVYKENFASAGIVLPVPEKAAEDGWTFIGWNKGTGNSGDSWTRDSKYDWEASSEQDGTLRLYASRMTTLKFYEQLDENALPSDKYEEQTIYYNAGLTIPAEAIDGGWTFEGYYNVADGKFAADGNEDKKVITTAKYTGAGNLDLYAKWTATANIDTTFKEVAVSSKTLSVTYRGEVSGLHTPEYTNNGKFVDWYVAGRETQIENKQIYTLGANETIYAKVKFPVVFDYQGATQKEEEKGKEYYIVYKENFASAGIVLPVPEKAAEDGWTFIGWNKGTGNSGDSWTRDSKYDWEASSEQDGTLRLYASRRSTVKFYSQLDENALSSDKYEEQTIYYNARLTVPAEAIAGDWTFEGYYNVADGIFTVDGNADKEIKSTVAYTGAGNLNLYAKWTSVVKFNVGTVAGETVSLGTPSLKELNVIFNGTLAELPEVKYGADDEGVSFDGWFTAPSGVGKQVHSEDIWTGGANQHLFAKTLIKIYFSDDLNNQPIEPRIAIYGRSIAESSQAVPILSNSGWSFKGWTVEGLGETTSSDFENYKIDYNHSITVDAIWDVTVYYDADKGNIKNVFANPYAEVRFGSVISLYTAANQGSWHLQGWYIDSTLTVGLGGNNNTVKTDSEEFLTLVANNIKNINQKYCLPLYAKWTTTAALNYGKFDTSSDSSLPSSVSVVYGQILGSKLPENLSPTYEGYLAGKGWYTAVEAEGEVTQYMTEYPLMMDILYYKWTGKEYTLTLQYINGTGDLITYAPIKVRLDAPMSKLDDSYMPVKDANMPDGDFLGYYYFENTADIGSPDKGRQYFDRDLNGLRDWDMPKDNITLYAQWGKFYIVNLDPNEGSGGTTEVTATYNQPMKTVLAGGISVVAPKRTGYEFIGFTENKDGSGTKYYDKNMTSAANWDKPSDSTIYAQWSAITYTVQFNSDGGNPITANSLVTFNQPYGSLPVPSKNNVAGSNGYTKFTFDHWEYNGQTITSSTIVKTAQNHTLIARWRSEWVSTPKPCVATGTLITLADGSQVPVEQLTGNEMLLVWNIYTGSFDAAPILFIDNEATASYEIVNLYFSDGSVVKIIYEHGFWDYDLNEWVFLRNDAAKYIGHRFNKQSMDGNGTFTNEKVRLVDVVITDEVTMTWSPVTFGHLCVYVNGLLSMPGATEGFINIFDVNPETMTVDEAKMAADIEKYGLFTYEDFAEYIPEEIFYAFNGQYLKVSMGKGMLTWDDIFALVSRYENFWG